MSILSEESRSSISWFILWINSLSSLLSDSVFQNKDKALEILRSRLLAQKQKEQQDAINANRQGQVGTGDRSEKIRTYNFPQDRCTDHRIGLTVHNLDKIMDGNLDEIIDALAMREQAEKLRQLDTQSDR